MAREDLRRGARDHRGRERRAQELHVAGGDHVIRALRRERGAARDGADHVAARRADLRLPEAVLGPAAECSEKFATRMLSAFLFWRI
jgi:hypothetical protein